MKIILSIFLILYFSQLQAQFQVSEESGVRGLLDSRRSANFKEGRLVKAWSVQIAISRDKYEILQKLSSVRAMFRNEIGVQADWTYDQPNYRLHAGAFYTKLEASCLLYKIYQSYPNAFVFRNSQIKPTDFQ